VTELELDDALFWHHLSVKVDGALPVTTMSFSLTAQGAGVVAVPDAHASVDCEQEMMFVSLLELAGSVIACVVLVTVGLPVMSHPEVMSAAVIPVVPKFASTRYVEFVSGSVMTMSASDCKATVRLYDCLPCLKATRGRLLWNFLPVRSSDAVHASVIRSPAVP
jgi:hypothetical protein